MNGIQYVIRTVTAAGAITVLTSDNIIAVNKTVGAATAVNLFATPVDGSFLIIKDEKGDAAANNITITPAAGTIDGAATYVMNVNRQSIRLCYNAATTNWMII